MTSATQIQNSQDFYDNSPELYGHFGLKNKNMFNYLKSYTSAYTDSVDVTTHDPIIVKPIVKPPQTKEGINILIVLSIVALLIVFLAALTVILCCCCKTNKVIPPQIKDMLNRTYSQKSTELELELSNPDIDSEKLNDVFIDVVNSNEDNYLILQEMGEDEKKIYVPQASQVFTDLTVMEKEINVKPKSIVVQESNPLLNPDRTIFYSLITGHTKEFDNIKINEELSEEEKFEQTNQLLRDKIEHFVNNLEKVYQTTNIGLTSNIEGAKQEYNGSVNNDRDWIEQFISNLWIQEKLTLYEVCNAAILTDLYYVVMGKKVEPRFYKQANISKKFKGLREILEILANFCACLCYLSTYYGCNREIEVELFRGDNMCDDTNYKEGEKYRFITFQSCSTNMNIAASYLINADSAFYTILMPNNCENSIQLKKEGFDNSDEYLIMPYASFKLIRTPDEFKYIDEGILDGEKEEKVREAKLYEMELSAKQFHNDKVKAKWWHRFVNK